MKGRAVGGLKCFFAEWLYLLTFWRRGGRSDCTEGKTGGEGSEWFFLVGRGSSRFSYAREGNSCLSDVRREGGGEPNFFSDFSFYDS